MVARFLVFVFIFGLLECVTLAPSFAAKPACSDGKDNDRDGLKDYPKDKGCKSRSDNDERNPPKITYGNNVALNGYRLFPRSNPWNRDVSKSPVDPNSDTLIASIGVETGLHPDFGTVWDGAPNGIPYVVVKGSQSKVRVTFDYADESDRGPYPIPRNPPIEGGPNGDGDRHILILDRDREILYELFHAFNTNGRWHAGSGAIFKLKSNSYRPAGWTSADAAGLPILPGLVRFDEVQAGKITHALRFTVSRSRRAYVSPARHWASSSQDANLPPMGMRVRLKASVNTSGFPKSVRVILEALKRYGMIVADNGSNWFISGAPNSKWKDDDLARIREIKGGDFEVIRMVGLVSD